MSYESVTLGGSGPLPVTGTAAVNGKFFALVAGASGCTFTALAGLSGAWAGFSLAPGQSLFAGDQTITSVQLSAGSAIAYRV